MDVKLINIDCHLDRIDSHLGDKPLGMLARTFLG